MPCAARISRPRSGGAGGLTNATSAQISRRRSGGTPIASSSSRELSSRTMIASDMPQIMRVMRRPSGRSSGPMPTQKQTIFLPQSRANGMTPASRIR